MASAKQYVSLAHSLTVGSCADTRVASLTLGPTQEDDVAERPAKAPRALPEFLLGSSISGHMAAKHIQAAAAAAAAADEHEAHLPSGIQSMADLNQTEMTEEQRQEAFRKAYMAELERYNGENEDEEVEVQVDKQGWDAEMNGDAMDDEELEDVEWEWCDDDEHGGDDIEVKVNGSTKRLVSVDDNDLLSMSQEEFLVRPLAVDCVD